jgi:hypothetical protein
VHKIDGDVVADDVPIQLRVGAPAEIMNVRVRDVVEILRDPQAAGLDVITQVADRADRIFQE